MKILGLIPARAGSKGIPQKNLREVAGRPLLSWAIKSATDSQLLDRIVVSTEDDLIADRAVSMGAEVPFRRPVQLAADTTPMLDVVLHALDELANQSYVPDAIAVLQPTSPLRRPQHIRTAIELLQDSDAVCSVIQLRRELSPYAVMRLDSRGYLRFFIPEGINYARRQDLPLAYRRDGTIYLTRRSVVVEKRSLYGDSCIPLVLEEAESVTVDEPEDLIKADQRLRAREAV